MIKLIQAQADSNAQGAKASERGAASEAQQKITNETDEDIEVSVGGQSYFVDKQSGKAFRYGQSGEPEEAGSWNSATREIEFN